MPQRQLAVLLPELEEGGGRDRELEAALELVARDSRAYRRQLGALRKLYSPWAYQPGEGLPLEALPEQLKGWISASL